MSQLTAKNVRGATKKSIFFFAGTRAEIIKLSPVINRLASDGIQVHLIWAGMHSRILLDNFNLQLRNIYFLHNETKDIANTAQAASWLIKSIIRLITLSVQLRFKSQKPRILVVHGDTFCTVLGACFGVLSGIRVAHVEAGLRSGRIFRPFPEELNRRAVSRMSNINFAPGLTAVKNLKDRKGKIVNTFHNTNRESLYDAVRDCDFSDKQYLLVTLHRTELLVNKKEFQKIVNKILELSSRIDIYWFIGDHERASLTTLKLTTKIENSNIHVIQRVSHKDFVKYLAGAHCVLTDSGGLQDECMDLGIPVIIHRRETEYPLSSHVNSLLTQWDVRLIEDFIFSLPADDPFRGKKLPLEAVDIIANELEKLDA